jgi:hypothetical protein
MRFVVVIFICILAGCASAQIPDYISRVDHPYDRQVYASFEKVTSAVIYVLKNKGWTVTTEAQPSIYERDDRYDNNGYQNLLITTNIQKHNHVLYSTFTHLNVFIHGIGNTCDVEIRYEAQTPLVKQFISTHNDQLINSILDAVEQEINK